IAVRPLVIMSSVLPRTSAAYNYSKNLIGPKVGGFYAYIYFAGRLTIAIFGISFAQYLASLVPELGNPLAMKIIGILVLSLFYLINLFGIKAAAKIQNIMVVVLLTGLVSYVAFGLPHVTADFFRAPDFFRGGFDGFYTALSLLFFAVSGAYIITDFAPSIDRPQQTIKKVIVMVTLGVCVLYMLIGVVASGVIPIEQAANQPLSVTAEIIFPNQFFRIFFIVGGAIGALVTTLNSSFVWYSKALIGPCADGLFPKSFAKKNKRDVPYVLMTVFYIFGLVPIIFSIDLAVLSKIAVGMTIFSLIIPMAGILKLEEKYKEAWDASKYSHKYSLTRRKVMLILTYIIFGTQVAYLFYSNPPLANGIIILYVGAVLIYLKLKK
ncbi:MAG: APC family permease, partial [Eubacterium sp.]